MPKSTNERVAEACRFDYKVTNDPEENVVGCLDYGLHVSGGLSRHRERFAPDKDPAAAVFALEAWAKKTGEEPTILFRRGKWVVRPTVYIHHEGDFCEAICAAILAASEKTND